MKKVDFARMLFGSFLALLLVFPGAAAANDVVAEVENLGDTLVFHPVVPFAELILTVTGPCNFEYRQRVTEGEPFFRLDPTTIDGMYRFELTVIPSIDPAIIEILQDARKNGDNSQVNQLCRDGKLPGDPAVQASGFRVFEARILFDPGAFEKAFRGDRDVTVDDLLAMVDEEAPVSKAPPAGNGRIPTKDFVIIDDLIVDGSACIGFDCVNGESFGFDTIRLKENNLRIKFDDTSTAASFPRNDWQLTANDSANGGASKFSIDDISGSRTPFTVEANARSHSLYVDDGGRIGSRTSTPSTEIHTIDGDTPTLRLQQDGSSGFAPQTWDVAGNETNFFIRDVTNGSQLPFRIRPDAPTSSIFIDNNGNVGFGTSSPTSAIHLDSTLPDLAMTDSVGDEYVIGNNNGEFRIRNSTDGRTDFTIEENGEVGINTVNPQGTLDVNGTIFLSGAQIHPDYVFEPDYNLPSIESHAESMWAKKSLPKVGPGAYNEEGQAVMELGQRSQGMLEELELAHVYIEQLLKEVKSLRAEVESLKVEKK